MFWNHSLWNAKWRTLCTEISEVNLSLFIYRLFTEDLSSVIWTETVRFCMLWNPVNAWLNQAVFKSCSCKTRMRRMAGDWLKRLLNPLLNFRNAYTFIHFCTCLHLYGVLTSRVPSYTDNNGSEINWKIKMSYLFHFALFHITFYHWRHCAYLKESAITKFRDFIKMRKKIKKSIGGVWLST